jgi:energy-coupling factor transporter ATP-binding protein EcfA2
MKPVLEVTQLAYARNGRQILSGITFSMAQGESVGLAGPNGAGKSTLLWCILGLLHAKGGVSKPATTAAVSQNPEDQLFMPSLLDDLMLPLLCAGHPKPQARAAALDSLRHFEMDALAQSPACELSLGQRKRAALALAMVRLPELLLLDEPTAELDPRASRLLASALQSSSAARLVASHDLLFLGRTCTRLIIIDQGRIQADGPIQALLDDRALLERHGLL